MISIKKNQDYLKLRAKINTNEQHLFVRENGKKNIRETCI